MAQEAETGTAPVGTAAGDGRTVLMESGRIRPTGDGCPECSVSRGMAAISADGEEVGRVAAVVLDGDGASPGVVLARWQSAVEYVLLPLSLIECVNGERVLLRIPAVVARELPRREVGG